MDTSQANPKRQTVPDFLNQISSDLQSAQLSTLAIQNNLASPTSWTFTNNFPSNKTVNTVPAQTRKFFLDLVQDPNDIYFVEKLLNQFDEATQSYRPELLAMAANNLEKIYDIGHVDKSKRESISKWYAIESYIEHVREIARDLLKAEHSLRFAIEENIALLSKMQSLFVTIMDQYASGKEIESILLGELRYHSVFLKGIVPAHYKATIDNLRKNIEKLPTISNEGIERNEPIWGSCLADILHGLEMWEPIDPNEENLFYNNDTRLAYLRKFVEYWLVDAEAILTILWINQEPLPISSYEQDWIELPLGKPMLAARHTSITRVFVDPQFIRPDWEDVVGPFFEDAAKYLMDRVEWAISSKKVLSSKHPYQQKALKLLLNTHGKEIRSMIDLGHVLAVLTVIGAVVSRNPFDDIDQIKGIYFVEKYQTNYIVSMSGISSISVLFSFEPEDLESLLERSLAQLKEILSN